jgi:hypothetical protein
MLLMYITDCRWGVVALTQIDIDEDALAEAIRREDQEGHSQPGIAGVHCPVPPGCGSGPRNLALPGVEGVEDLPGESRVGGCDECLAWRHGAGDIGQGGQVVVEGQGLAVEAENRASGGVQDVGEAGGDVAQADRAEVDADTAASRAIV